MLSRPFIFLIKLYQRFISPLSPGCCRYTPTCSQYAIDALREWGLICGTGLAIWRILRCNPFGRGGWDPVPVCPWRQKRRDRAAKKRSPKGSVPEENGNGGESAAELNAEFNKE